MQMSHSYVIKKSLKNLFKNLISTVKELVIMRREGNSFALLVGMQSGAATVESSMEIPQKLKMDLPLTQ